MVAVIVLFYLTVGFVEIVPMIKKKQKKELWLYSMLILISFIISFLLGLGIEIPSPAGPIRQLIEVIKGE